MYYVILNVLENRSDSVDIGIIGGADGPTSIFIATSVNWPLSIGIGIAIVLIVVGFIMWKKKHKE